MRSEIRNNQFLHILQSLINQTTDNRWLLLFELKAQLTDLPMEMLSMIALAERIKQYVQKKPSIILDNQDATSPWNSECYRVS